MKRLWVSIVLRAGGTVLGLTALLWLGGWALHPGQQIPVPRESEEIARVEATCTALAAGDLAEIGRLLTASHGSSRDWFDNSTPELDHLVELLTATAGVYGARLTGGGFGGAVMALTTPDFEAAAQTVAKAYAGRFGAEPEVLHLRVGPGAELLPSS
jgi:galactokinase